MNTPSEILEIWIGNGVKKASLPIYKMILLGLLAGAFIGFGAHVFINATAVGDTGFESMIAKLVGSALFPVGLMMVVLCGAELFTGNNLMTLALMEKQISVSGLLKNWVVVYLANFVGSVAIAFLFSQSGLYTGAAMDRAIAVAESKCAVPFMSLFVRGILCNMLVVLALWLQTASKEVIGKIFGIWFLIMLFVFAGFEHSIANMTYIPLGMFLGADLNIGNLVVGNLLPVTLGNIVGGAIIIPVFYRLSYGK